MMMMRCKVSSFPVLLGLCLLYVSSSMAQGYREQNQDEEDKYQHALRLLEQLVETRKGLSALRGVIKGIDQDLLETQKRTCAVGGGMSHHCAAALLDSQLVAADWLRNGYSPGKRSAGGDAQFAAAERSGAQNSEVDRKRWSSCAIGLGMSGYQCHLASLHDNSDRKEWVTNHRLSPGKRGFTSEDVARKVKDLSHKRKGLEIMNKLVDQMDGDLVNEQKRTCAVNLGGRCAAEGAASLADQWHYLNSPLSPGRKRRDTRLYQRLIKGKLFQ